MVEVREGLGSRAGRPRGFDREVALGAAMTLFWRKGYEATSVSELCAAMSINPPSLYSAFGSKSRLFLSVVERYERTFWDPVWERLAKEPDVRRAFTEFYDTASEVLSSRDGHQGCLVTLSAISLETNVGDVADALSAIGAQGVERMFTALRSGVEAGQIPEEADLPTLAQALSVVFDGLAIRARDGLTIQELKRIGHTAVRMIPAV